MCSNSIPVFAGLIVSCDIFLSVFNPADRSPGLQRSCTDHDFFGHHPVFRSKSPTDVRSDDPKPALGQAEAFSDSNTHHVRTLGRQIEFQFIPVVVPDCERGPAFERNGRMPVHSKLVGYRYRSGSTRLIDITAVDLALDEQIVLPAFV